MIKENISKYNVLITNGDKKKVSVKDVFNAHLWIHDNIINKNHITFTYTIDSYIEKIIENAKK